MYKLLIDDFKKFLDASPTCYHAVDNLKSKYLKKGFIELHETESWNLEIGGKYFIIRGDSAIVSFILGKDTIENGFRIIGAHSDSPGFRIKSNPIIEKEGYLTVNTEIYGGPILYSWFDRDLSFAGRVAIKSNDLLNPEIRLVNIDKDLFTIPSLCIHMNRGINDNGVKFNPQKETLPLLGISSDMYSKNAINKLIADDLNIDEDSILDFDLFLYDRQKVSLLGVDTDMLHSGRLDNLAMTHCSSTSILNADAQDFTSVVVINDNEEVGSSTIQGADSTLLDSILKRILYSLNASETDILRTYAKSFFISADMGHAVHPNYSDEHDPTNRPVLGGGPVLKISARKSYTSDALTGGVFKQLCNSSNVNYQVFHNRSDKLGGTTISPITATQISIPSVDVGNPMLSMHSVRELINTKDHYDMKKVFDTFFSNK